MPKLKLSVEQRVHAARLLAINQLPVEKALEALRNIHPDYSLDDIKSAYFLKFGWGSLRRFIGIDLEKADAELEKFEKSLRENNARMTRAREIKLRALKERGKMLASMQENTKKSSSPPAERTLTPQKTLSSVEIAKNQALRQEALTDLDPFELRIVRYFWFNKERGHKSFDEIAKRLGIDKDYAIQIHDEAVKKMKAFMERKVIEAK